MQRGTLVVNKVVSIVIPALNEKAGIRKVLDEIPREKLRKMKYDVEIIVVDGGSSDGTREIALDRGAKVIVELRRGYGRAYKTGLAAAKGEIIITGDADGQYPFSLVPVLVKLMKDRELLFINTNRFYKYHPAAWRKIKLLGNKLLTLAFNVIFRSSIKDCQSGMWIINRELLRAMRISSDGMEFSVEIKAQALKNAKNKFIEAPIYYRPRIDPNVKLRILRDSLRNLVYMLVFRLRRYS
jgi:glycosyltransferase involved in cell wall biosynthesis